jgi:predicted Zn-dependent protease with MMP-like domain
LVRGRSKARDRHGDYRAPIHCVEHGVDIAAVQRFIEDGKPTDLQAAVEAIAAGECPACRPRYVERSPREATVADAGGGTDAQDSQSRALRRVQCPCCRTSWELEEAGWVATVDGGLQITGQPEPIPTGETIDSSWFVVDPFDPIEGPEQALRREFLAFDASTDHPAPDDLVDDLTEAMLEAARGKADEHAELGRIELEHHLDETAADGWQLVALAGLAVMRGLLGGETVPPSRHNHRGGGMDITRERFEELVVRALDSIPPDLASRMENVAVVVADEAVNFSGAGDLLGLYEGIPLTKRDHYRGTPDRITIYQNPISRRCRTEAEIVAKVRVVVIHEVGHHFGISDPRLHELGWG